MRNKLDSAISIGECAKKISYQLAPDNQYLAKIVPILLVVLLKFQRIQDCYKLLQELHFSIKSDIFSLTWYYALCMDLHLDTGNEHIIEYETCKQHYIEILSTKGYEKSTDACRRFIANFWNWNLLRDELFEMPKSWLINVFEVQANPSFNDFFTEMRLIEGFLQQLKIFKKEHNFDEVTHTKKIIKHRLKKIKKVKFSVCFSKRIKLYEEYFAMI